ncbi:MAG: thermonuclease family protein [Erysipelotrichales bacterium]|nr:thermonuclease family protein [Erysipelotrichales bacterium]
MKKVIFAFLICLVFLPRVNASEENLISAELVKCDSLSNIWLSINNDIKRIHLLAFETESGFLDDEINNYICSILSSSSKIQIEYDIEKKDKYNRELVYLYVDGKILQNELLSLGYGQVDNVLHNYRYLSDFCNIQKEAIIKKSGIWNYPNIEEKYCNSGVAIEKFLEEDEEKQEDTTKINKTLKFIVFLNSLILIMILLIKKGN